MEMSCSLRIEKIYPEKYKYTHPIFNPNNKTEIAYVRSSLEGGVLGPPELWTFNFCTGEAKQLADYIANAPDWSVKDWIIFRGSGKQIKKIKSNGDSLTVLPEIKGGKLAPKWNDNGDLFGLRVNNKNYGNQVLIATENGEGLGVFNDFILKNWDWTGNQISYVDAGDGQQSIKLFNFETRTSYAIETIEDFHTSDSLFLNTIYDKERERVFWNQLKQICYTDLKSKQRKVVTKGADNRLYYQIDLSADGETIIASRVDFKKIDACKKEERWNLVLIDLTTGEERLVRFPKEF